MEKGKYLKYKIQGKYMNIDLFNKIEEAVEKTKQEIQSNTQTEEIELAKKLDAVEEYSVDRFEGEYAILENRKTSEIKKVQKDSLPENIKEGSVLEYVNGKYIYNEETTNFEKAKIKGRMDQLWN